MNAIVIEHDPLACQDLCDQLADVTSQAHVRFAASPNAATDLLSGFTADVVFLDLQMPEGCAFRLVDRVWLGGIPVIVCTTEFDQRLVAGLQYQRVEHLIRPFGRDQLHYTMTRGRRPDRIDPADNFARLLQLGRSLGYLPARDIFAFRKGKTTSLDVEDVGAIHDLGHRYLLWTASGIWETNWAAVQRILQRRQMERGSRNGMVRTQAGLSLHDGRCARRWLRRQALLDALLRRRSTSRESGEKPDEGQQGAWERRGIRTRL